MTPLTNSWPLRSNGSTNGTRNSATTGFLMHWSSRTFTLTLKNLRRSWRVKESRQNAFGSPGNGSDFRSRMAAGPHNGPRQGRGFGRDGEIRHAHLSIRTFGGPSPGAL